MDPVSILALTGASAKIFQTCGSAVWNLREIRQRWKNAPALLKSIERECDTIATTTELMTRWFESRSREAINDQDFTRALLSALEYCLEVLQGLEQSTAECSSSNSDPARWKRFKQLVNEPSLRRSLEELRWHAQATNNLWLTFNLAASERRNQVQQIRTSLQVHSSRTSVGSSSRASILSVDFADDEKDSQTTFAGASRGSNRFARVIGAEKKTQTVPDISGRNSSMQELDGRPVDSHARTPDRSSRTGFRSMPNLVLLGFGLTCLVVALVLNWLDGALPSTIEPIKPVPTRFYSEALLTAAAAGSRKDTSELLKAGAKPSIRNSQLRTPLHLAAANGNLGTIKLLLKQKSTGWYADDNVTPLHLAARYGHTDAVKLITKIPSHDWHRETATAPQAIRKLKTATGNGTRFDRRFADFFARKTFTARELAIMYRHVDTALSFPSTSNDDIRDALSCACMLGDVQMVEEIVDHYNNRWNFQRHSSIQSRVRWFPAPPLHLAVTSGDRATVVFFLERGWKANRQSWRSIFNWSTDSSPLYSSPAHYAAMNGSTALLEALWRRGADADLTSLDHRSRTPLSYAVENVNEAAVKFLVKRKHPRRGPILGWCFFGKCALRSYLGPGHVWQDSNLRATAIPSIPIRRALQDVGFFF